MRAGVATRPGRMSQASTGSANVAMPATPTLTVRLRQVYAMGEDIPCSCARVVTWRVAADDRRLAPAFVTVWHRPGCAGFKRQGGAH